MKSIFFILVLLLSANGLFASCENNNRVMKKEFVRHVDIKNGDYIIRHNQDGSLTTVDDGCKGVYIHQYLVWNVASGQYEWVDGNADCICDDCSCTC